MTSRRGLYHPFRALLSARRLAVAVVLAGFLAGCGERDADGTWELPNGDLAGTRAATGASIDAGNVSGLGVRWRYALTAKANYSGTFASTPVADQETVYVQDLQSNVHALERATGKVRWVHRYRALNEGPERARSGRRAGLWRDRLGRVRAFRRHRPPALEPASHQRHRAVRRHRARRLGRARLHQYRRLPAGRARRDLRAGRRDRCRALEVRHDPGAVAASARGRRGWALVSGVRRRRGSALRGELEPAALGRIPRAPERRRLPRPGALHELVARVRRAQRPAALARPGDAARHPRLRLRGDADPGDGRGRGARLRRRQGGTGDRLGPRDASGGAGRPPSGSTATTSARCRPGA